MMGVYTVKDALEELEELRLNLLDKAEEYLRKGNNDAVAAIIVSIEMEVRELVREGRRLRLRGELDREVYKTLIDGYYDVLSDVWELTEKYGAKDDVRLFYIMRLDAIARARR